MKHKIKQLDDVATIYKPDKALRNVIGSDVSLDTVFSPNVLKMAQQLINEARDSSFEQFSVDIKTLDIMLVKIAQTGNAAHSAAFVDIAEHVANIKGVAEFFNYRLVSNVCKHIIKYCETTHYQYDTRIGLIKELTNILHVVIKEKINDDSNVIGRKLQLSLDNF
jgi:hypothetical protein